MAPNAIPRLVYRLRLSEPHYIVILNITICYYLTRNKLCETGLAASDDDGMLAMITKYLSNEAEDNTKEFGLIAISQLTSGSKCRRQIKVTTTTALNAAIIIVLPSATTL